MSSVKKLKKTKKGMSEEGRRNLGLAFKSIISNQACVDGGKDAPWWIAIIFLCVSILLPLIPIMTKTSKLNGSSFLDGYTFRADEGLYQTTSEVVELGLAQAKVSGGLISFYEDDGETLIPEEDVRLAKIDENPIMPISTVVTSMGSDEGSEYTFRLFITNYTGIRFEALVNELALDKFVQGTTTPASIEDDITTLYYIPSFLLIGKETMVMALFGRHSISASAASPSGLDYLNAPQGVDLFSTLLVSDTGSVLKNTQDTFTKYKTFFANSYLNAKSTMFRKTTLIYLAVYAGLILFLGLMVFILTRGKNNVFKFLSFFTCQKIAWWAAFTPGLLGMILAFILPSSSAIGQMSFVVLLSLRVMWLAMKQLKPVQ